MPNLSQSRPTRRRASLRPVLAVLVAAASLLGVVAPADAREYRVFTCRTPVGAVAQGADWLEESRADAPSSSNICIPHGQMYATLGVGQRSSQARTGFGLHLPDGLLLKRLEANRSVMLMPGTGGDNGATVRYDLFAGSSWADADSIEGCEFRSGCTGWAWDGAAGDPKVVRTFSEGVSFAGFAIACSGDSWGACGVSENGRAHLRVNSADLTIDDSYVPQAGTPLGALLQPGPRRGTQELVFGATDRGSGIYEAIVRLDGTEIARSRPDASPSCADAGVLPGTTYPDFQRVRPCSTSVSASFSIDTTKLPDGVHKLAAVVRDAAGNVSTAVSQDVTIDNVPPPVVVIKPTITGPTMATGLRPGDAVTAQNGVWSGPTPTFGLRWQRSTTAGAWADVPNATGGTYRVGTDDLDRQLRVVVTATSSEGSTEVASEATGFVTSGKTVGVQSNGPSVKAPAEPGNGAGGNPATGQLVVDREQRTVDVRHGAKIVITGRLVDADGNPIADASLDVFEQIAVTAAPWTKVGTVKTDSQGGYVYRPMTTASRRLRFAYSDKREASDYRATREVFISVTAAMNIKARHRVVPRRGLIRLSGQVLVDKLPSKGAWVEVQVLDAGVWRTVATRRVDDAGRWTFKHRLRDASATRFTFRSRLRAAGDLATAEAKSVPVKVRVR